MPENVLSIVKIKLFLRCFAQKSALSRALESGMKSVQFFFRIGYLVYVDDRNARNGQKDGKTS